jgi:hypothetical protein
MFAMRACRKSTMVGEPLNAKQMTTVSPIPSPRHGCRPRPFIPFRNVHVLTDQLDFSTHGNDGTTVDLPAWRPMMGTLEKREWEARGLDNIQPMLWLVEVHFFTVTSSAVFSWYLRREHGKLPGLPVTVWDTRWLYMD